MVVQMRSHQRRPLEALIFTLLATLAGVMDTAAARAEVQTKPGHAASRLEGLKVVEFAASVLEPFSVRTGGQRRLEWTLRLKRHGRRRLGLLLLAPRAAVPDGSHASRLGAARRRPAIEPASARCRVVHLAQRQGGSHGPVRSQPAGLCDPVRKSDGRPVRRAAAAPCVGEEPPREGGRQAGLRRARRGRHRGGHVEGGRPDRLQLSASRGDPRRLDAARSALRDSTRPFGSGGHRRDHQIVRRCGHRL